LLSSRGSSFAILAFFYDYEFLYAILDYAMAPIRTSGAVIKHKRATYQHRKKLRAMPAITVSRASAMVEISSVVKPVK